ncbi:hypothetical protein HJB79_18455 [Rhizobium lentis]|uniref:hypothetical protein n=1 Tax=Rhizobium lentis TaxID=1138194 RepID=UPI001C83E476|nr:hypothetical protein [Rhizobium lentis]MBX5140736.1 hypothetical protein [Rhizobium lentis]
MNDVSVYGQDFRAGAHDSKALKRRITVATTSNCAGNVVKSRASRKMLDYFTALLHMPRRHDGIAADAQ